MVGETGAREKGMWWWGGIQGKEGVGKHERMVSNSLLLPCGDNRGVETHCSRRAVPVPSRSTGLGMAHGCRSIRDKDIYHLI